MELSGRFQVPATLPVKKARTQYDIRQAPVSCIYAMENEKKCVLVGKDVLEDIKSINIRNWKKVTHNRDSWKQARTLYRL